MQEAIRTYPRQYHTKIVVYFPNGTYYVDDTLQYLTGYYDAYVTLYGEDSDSTIIKLRDNTPGFGDPENPSAVIRTRAGKINLLSSIFLI